MDDFLTFDDPALIKVVLSKPHPSYMLVGAPKYGLCPGVLAATGSEQKRLRSFGHHLVSKRSLEAAFDLIRINTTTIIAALARSSVAKPVFPDSFLKQSTYNAVCILFVGGNQSQLHRMKMLSEAFITFGNMLLQKFLPEWMDFKGNIAKGLAARDSIINECRSVIDERMENGESYEDGLDALIAAKYDGDHLPKEDIVKMFFNLVVVAVETTSDQMATLLHHLANSILPQDLHDLCEEVSRPGVLDSISSISSLPLLDAFVKESQRLCSSVPMNIRVASEDFELDGVKIPAGTAFAPLRNRGFLVDNPDEFRIARFLGADAYDKANPMEFLPFGTGERMCLGMNFAKLQMKVMVATLLRSYKITGSSEDPKYFYFPRSRIDSKISLEPLTCE
ncbi:hypothetical protein HDU82_005121 [Entophlyctis luteolus]|nr:hypothetical protein HDU82_005121 [Entophlyctis luteolus]